jgi:phosphate-selective porin OprO/OprP
MPGRNTQVAPNPVTAATADPLPFESYWNNGLHFRTPDRSFVAHVGMSLHYDAAWYSGGLGVQEFPGGVGRFDDGVNPRRLRLMTDGTWHDTFDYKLDVEFTNGSSTGTGAVSDSPGPTDAYITVRQLPWVGNVRVGNQKEWFSLEHLESQRAIMFMERSPLFDASQPSAFNAARSPGVSLFRTWANDSLFTAVGVYKNISDPLGYGVGDGQYAVTGRVAALPVWMPEMQTYWHVGGAMSLRDPVGGLVRVRVRDSVRNAPSPLLNLVADTGAIPADQQTLFNLESAFASGPLTVSGEFTTNLINTAIPGVGTVTYHGFYTQAKWFLTGEHREWDPKNGVFKRIKPRHNFDPKHGTWGAVEVGGRYSFLDLDDRGINGGRLSDLTLGVNWYWTPNLKLQVNYDYLYRDGGPNPLARGSIHALGTRLALDF